MTRSNHHYLLVSLVACVIPHSYILGQDEPAPEVYTGPKAVEYVMPNYPRSVGRKGGEGWVVINYMVDTKGKAFEPSVVASTGSELFESVALEALEESTFKPANINGRPVEGSNVTRYNFALPKEKSAMRHKFYERYEKIRDNFDTLDQSEFEKRLKKLENSVALNHYERAYLDYARYRYALRFESKLTQMRHIESALQYDYLYDEQKTYLPDSIAFPLRRQLFELEVENKRYAEALKTLEVIRRSGEQRETLSVLQPLINQLVTVKNGDSPYTISEKTDKNGRWSILLYKPNFIVQGNNSNLNEIKLRCEGKYVFFEFKADATYQIPENSGQCYFQLLGAANESFDFVQF